MRIILQSRSWYIAGAAGLILTALWLLTSVFSEKQVEYITTTVTRGDITEVVAVSGVVEAQNTAQLAFPVTGIVTEVFVDEGDVVAAGDVLATLASARLVAERNDAVAALRRAQADKAELVAGPRGEARTVTDTTVANTQSTLSQVTAEQNERVINARQTLLSSDLGALTDDIREDAAPPTVSGTYTCDTEGTYIVDVYRSNANTGFSYRVSGLESGTYNAFTETAGAFGTCGLFLQFTAGEKYNLSSWTIAVPNTRSSQYITNKNAYELAVTQRKNAIEAALNASALASNEATLANAAPRTEEITRADAAITQAQARIAVIDAELADRSIVAPFAGTITNIDILPGETAPNTPVITLLANDGFELAVRIPEIDVTKIITGQNAEILFDAQSDTLVYGTVDFISPLATEIDGVAYFEAMITFNDTPAWLRSGLNADVNIIVDSRTDVLRLSKRFITTADGLSSVLLPAKQRPVTTEIEIGFSGNDGYTEVIGLSEGTEVIAP